MWEKEQSPISSLTKKEKETVSHPSSSSSSSPPQPHPPPSFHVCSFTCCKRDVTAVDCHRLCRRCCCHLPVVSHNTFSSPETLPSFLPPPCLPFLGILGPFLSDWCKSIVSRKTEAGQQEEGQKHGFIDGKFFDPLGHKLFSSWPVIAIFYGWGHYAFSRWISGENCRRFRTVLNRNPFLPHSEENGDAWKWNIFPAICTENCRVLVEKIVNFRPCSIDSTCFNS